MTSLPFSRRVIVNLGSSPTRSISDEGWEVIDLEHVEYWKHARAIFNHRSFVIDGESIHLNVNWNPLFRRVGRDFRIMQELNRVKGTEKVTDVLNKFVRSPVKLEFHFSTENRKNSGLFESVAVCFLNDVFLIMNLSCPASIDLYNGSIRSLPRFRAQRIALSNVLFEAVLLDSRDGKWPPVGPLPMSDVTKWFYTVRGALTMRPSNRAERVLFAILHICRADPSPMSVVWIFYSLETLFDTKPGEKFRTLIARITLLLHPDQKQLSKLRKNLCELYAIRSAFVHGGLDVIHPILDDILDNSLDDSFYKLMKSIDFGFQLVISSLQETIRRGWREPIFTEVLENSPKL